jgi:hypothetical protein
MYWYIYSHFKFDTISSRMMMKVFLYISFYSKGQLCTIPKNEEIRVFYTIVSIETDNLTLWTIIICAFRFHIRQTWFLYNVGTNSLSQCNWVTKTAINQLVDNDEMFMRYASNLLWCYCSKSYLMRTKAYIDFLLIFGHIRYRIQVLPSVIRGKFIDEIRIPFFSTSSQGVDRIGWLLRFLLLLIKWRFHMRPHMKSNLSFSIFHMRFAPTI